MDLHQQGGSGLGLSKPLVIPPKGTQTYRKFISDLSEDIEKENDFAKTTQFHLQGNWVRWCDHVKMDLLWKSLLAIPQPLISFCI